MIPELVVDRTLCTDPMGCRRCLVVCPGAVLSIAATKGPQKFRETDPKEYAVRGTHLLACSGCMECVRACPQRALQVVMGGD